MSLARQTLLIPRQTVLVFIFLILSLIGFWYHRSITALSSNAIKTGYSGPTVMTVTDKNYQGLSQEDPGLISYIRTLIHPPSTAPYRLKRPGLKHYTFREVPKFLWELYGPGKRKGFFVDVGANDGEYASNTLFLERKQEFKGVLIEANPRLYNALIRKNRKAYCLNAALSPTKTSAELRFTGKGQQGELTNKIGRKTTPVKVFPVFSIISALNVSFIDVFGLDIQGFELKVAKTIPHDKLRVGVWIIHHYNLSPSDISELEKHLARNGYVKIHKNEYDFFFADPNYLKKLTEWENSN